MGKVFEHFATEFHGDDGSVGFVTLVTLADVVDDLYPPNVGMDLKTMIRVGIQDPDVPGQ